MRSRKGCGVLFQNAFNKGVGAKFRKQQKGSRQRLPFISLRRFINLYKFGLFWANQKNSFLPAPCFRIYAPIKRAGDNPRPFKCKKKIYNTPITNPKTPAAISASSGVPSPLASKRYSFARIRKTAAKATAQTGANN